MHPKIYKPPNWSETGSVRVGDLLIGTRCWRSSTAWKVVALLNTTAYFASPFPHHIQTGKKRAVWWCSLRERCQSCQQPQDCSWHDKVCPLDPQSWHWTSSQRWRECRQSTWALQHTCLSSCKPDSGHSTSLPTCQCWDKPRGLRKKVTNEALILLILFHLQYPPLSAFRTLKSASDLITARVADSLWHFALALSNSSFGCSL